MSEYGEPWGIKEHGYIYSQDDFRIGECFSERWTGQTRTRMAIDSAERIVRCVNALASVKNPAAVKAVIENARAICEEGFHDFLWVSDRINAITQALAELDKEQTEALRKAGE